jgi:hypothetical protein
MRKVAALASALLAACLVGCATIASPGDDPVSFVSSPSGARVTVRDEQAALVHEGETPFQLELEAHDGYFDPASYQVRFEKACYESVEVHFSGTLEPLYFGNILLGGLIGMLIVDPLTGEMWTIDDDVGVALKEVPQCQPPEPETAPAAP